MCVRKCSFKTKCVCGRMCVRINGGAVLTPPLPEASAHLIIYPLYLAPMHMASLSVFLAMY